MGVANLGTAYADNRCATVVRAIRQLPATADLVQGAGEAILELGFDRVILSETRDGNWVPLHVAIANGPAAARNPGLGQRRGHRLCGNSPEASALNTQAPFPVLEMLEDSDRGRVAAVKYLSAVLVIGHEIAGFIHVDRFHSRRPFTQRDVDLLTMMSEVLGLAYERAFITDKLGSVADQLGSLVSGGPMVDPVAQYSRPVPKPGPPDFRLTPREQDVADLVAKGYTNGQIAAELVVSEATVKSHVKQLLRKLRATHRAEAVAKLLGARAG